MKIKSKTVIERVKAEVDGFTQMYRALEQKAILGGLSESTLNNYGRCIAKIALYFKQVPTALEEEQINGYLYDLKRGNTPSNSYFKTYRLWLAIPFSGCTILQIKQSNYNKQQRLIIIMESGTVWSETGGTVWSVLSSNPQKY